MTSRRLLFAVLALLFGLPGCVDLPPPMHLLGEELTDSKTHYTLDTYSFYHPVALAADSVFLYVGDSEDGEIVVFDRSLHLVRTIGRKGEGPLEFVSLTDLLSDAGFLYVLDGGMRRLSRLSMNGDTLATAIVSIGSSGSIELTNRGTLLVSGVSLQSEGRVQEYDADLKKSNEYFEIPDVQERHARSRGTSVALRVGNTLVLMSSHSPLVETLTDSVHSEFDYSDAFCSMYPFFSSFLKLNDKLRNTSGGYVGLFCFGKGAQLGRFNLMPGPLYSIVALDIENLRITSINTGELSEELSRWGYGSFSDVVSFGESFFLSASSASVLVEVSRSQLETMLEHAEWHSPVLIKKGGSYR